MKVRVICTALVMMAAILLMPPAHAQQIGFRVAIAPPNSPVQPFVSSPVASFAVAPMIMPPVISTFAGPSHFQSGRLAPQPWPFATQPAAIPPNRGVVVVAPGSTIYAPGATVVAGGNNVIITNPVAIPNTAIAPGGSIYPGPVGMPGIYVNTNPQGMRGSNGVLPAAGTPRSQVIVQFGSPLVSVLTMNCETMHFNDGITISLQNGLVIRP